MPPRPSGHDVAALAEAALASGRAADALGPVAAALAASPDAAALWHWQGMLLRALDRHGEAAAALERAAALRPADGRVAHARARVALEAGLNAVALFDRAHRLEPANGDILLDRAAALAGEGDAAGAIAALDALTAAHPGWYPGHEKLAQLRWTAGDRTGFTRSIDRALEAAPRDLSLWRMLLSLWSFAGRPDAVVALADRAQSAIGEDPGVLANAAAAHSVLGDRATADRLYARLISLPDPFVALAHVRHLLRVGQVEAADARLRPLLDGPAAAHAWPYQAVVWRLRGDPRLHWLEGDPALVGVYDLTDAVPGGLDALAQHLRTLHRARAAQFDQSVRAGTQTDGPLFSRVHPAIAGLRAAVVEAVAAHLSRLPPRDPAHPTLGPRRDTPVRFAGSWSVRLRGGGHHANHVHPQGWFSSAFYVAVPTAAEAGPPPAGFLALGSPDASLGLDLSPARLIEPEPGRLVLFPSTMWHGTVPVACGERLTVAFDVARPEQARA